MKIVFATPTIVQPLPAYRESLEKCLPLLDANGIEHQFVQQVANPYISNARCVMTRKALDVLTEPTDAIIYIDHDVSWEPEDLLKLIKTEGDVVAGTYRYKVEHEEYMGTWNVDPSSRPLIRTSDGAIDADMTPAGFLKVTVMGIIRFMKAHPKLIFGLPYYPHIDLFNHGAHEGIWWGEDYAFCRNYIAAGGKVWLVPDLNLGHWGPDPDKLGEFRGYMGNLHKWLLRQPGGSKDPARLNKPLKGDYFVSG